MNPYGPVKPRRSNEVLSCWTKDKPMTSDRLFLVACPQISFGIYLYILYNVVTCSNWNVWHRHPVQNRPAQVFSLAVQWAASDSWNLCHDSLELLLSCVFVWHARSDTVFEIIDSTIMTWFFQTVYKCRFFILTTKKILVLSLVHSTERTFRLQGTYKVWLIIFY